MPEIPGSRTAAASLPRWPVCFTKWWQVTQSTGQGGAGCADTGSTQTWGRRPLGEEDEDHELKSCARHPHHPPWAQGQAECSGHEHQHLKRWSSNALSMKWGLQKHCQEGELWKKAEQGTKAGWREAPHLAEHPSDDDAWLRAHRPSPGWQFPFAPAKASQLSTLSAQLLEQTVNWRVFLSFLVQKTH